MQAYVSLTLVDNSEVGEMVLDRCSISFVCNSAFKDPAKKEDSQFAMREDLAISPTCEVMPIPALVLGRINCERAWIDPAIPIHSFAVRTQFPRECVSAQQSANVVLWTRFAHAVGTMGLIWKISPLSPFDASLFHGHSCHSPPNINAGIATSLTTFHLLHLQLCLLTLTSPLWICDTVVSKSIPGRQHLQASSLHIVIAHDYNSIAHAARQATPKNYYMHILLLLLCFPSLLVFQHK